MSEIRVENIIGETGTDAVKFTKGINVTGIVTATNVSIGSSVTATSFFGSGAALTGVSAGKILQVVVNEKSGVTSISGQSNSGTFDNVTGYNISITPTKASSKILVQYTIGKYSHNGNTTAFRFTRSVAGGSASVIKVGDAAGNRKQISFARTYTVNNNHAESFHYQFLDTPSYSVGQAIVYQLQCNSESSNSVYFNRSITDDNETYNYRGRAFSTITAMEVEA